MSSMTVSAQMDEILEEYSREVKSKFEDSISKVTKEAVQKLRNTSPNKTGSYAKGWRVKKVSATTQIVHNATDGSLTHLLENGHIIRNKKGTYGRTRGIKHIAPVAGWAENELPREIKRALE